MKLQERKALLLRLGAYLSSNNEAWQLAKEKAFAQNNWFTPEYIALSIKNIANNFLQEASLTELVQQYNIPEENTAPKKVGIVMAGNIPLVGFHDLLCVFMSGNYAFIKPSSKDEVLVQHIVSRLVEWDPGAANYFIIGTLLKNCDAYIATGSNNSSNYFEYYFRNVPHIIRKNRTSVAVLTGSETQKELEALGADVYQYFGLGCRNVTKLYVPEHYNFEPLLHAFKKYDQQINHNKYKNNYDYNLALHLLNNRYYMTNGSILLVEDAAPFAPIGQVHYEYYTNEGEVRLQLLNDERIQCVVGRHGIDFGAAQCPAISSFADGVDTMQFLMQLTQTL